MVTRLNRRRFLHHAAAAACSAAPLVIPASALGRADRPAPSERIVMGSIGVGNMGFADMNAFMGIPDVQVVAACDVKSTMRDRAQQAVNAHYGTADCATYNRLVCWP